MHVWTGVIFVLFLAIVGYLLREFFLEEGFQSSVRAPVSARILELQKEDAQFRQTADIQALTQNFEKKRDLYHYAYGPNSLPIDASILAEHPDLPAQLDAATETSGFPIRLSQAIREVGIPASQTLQNDLDVCRQYQTPEEIPVNNTARCGWYHVPDTPSEFRTSYCVPGNDKGPAQGIVGLPTGGIWYWNKDAAIAAEAKKFCKRETNCKLQNTSESCAFCAEKGHSIPYDRLTRQPLYGETCSRVIGNPTDCPADASTDECETTTDTTIRQTCILKLMKNQGVNTDGLLYKYVNDGLKGAAKERFDILLKVMNTRARWQSDQLETANLSLNEQLNMSGLAKKIRKIVAAKTSYDTIVAGIARHFVDGTVFDSTAYYSQTAQSTTDPSLNATQHALALGDLQQEFRKAGCQASGADYPTELPTGTDSLADHRAKFQGLYLDMFNQKNEKQTDAIRRCLNSTLYTGPSAAPSARGRFCNEPGIEYLIYSPAKGPFATLIGRLVSPVGFLGSGSSYGEAKDLRIIMAEGPLADQPQVSYVARTMFSLDTSTSLGAPSFAPSTTLGVPSFAPSTTLGAPSFAPSTTLGAPSFSPSTATQIVSTWDLPQLGTYEFRVNSVPLSYTRPRAPNIPYTLNQPTLFEMQYTIESTDASQKKNWGSPVYPYIFQNLRKFRLIQESYKPFIQFDFSQGSDDMNRIATLQPLRSETPIQFTPKFTAAPTTAPSPNIAASYGLMSPVLITPRIRSSMIQILDLIVYTPTAGLLLKLIGGDSYSENLRIYSDRLEYTVNNGADALTYTANFPANFKPYETSQRYVLVFTKSKETFELSVQFLYTEAGQLKSLGSASKQKVAGSIEFRRSLQIQLLDQGFQGSLEKFHIYDRKSLKGAEGFQNPSDIPDILQETADGSRILPETAEVIDRSSYVPKTILSPSSVASIVGGPVGTCTFTPKPFTALGFQYKEGYTYNKVFADAVPSRTDKLNSLKECYDSCAANSGCVGINYADDGSCTYYQSINSDKMTDRANSVSIIMPGQDKSLVDMRNRVRTAIQNYVAIRTALTDSTIAQSKFKDDTRYIDRTITDDNVAADLKAIESINSVECLNAFLEKYTLTTK